MNYQIMEYGNHGLIPANLYYYDGFISTIYETIQECIRIVDEYGIVGQRYYFIPTYVK
jgi:hypothetical protein